MKFEFVVEAKDDGRPAFEILTDKGMSRLLLKRVRIYGDLLVNGVHQRMKDPLHTGEHIVALYRDDHEEFTLRENHGIHIYYEDEWCIVCEKPADLVTHPSWQHMDDSLIQRLSEHTLHPVMRLDRETSGLIVVAKNGFSHHAIAFAPMEKKYLALVYGRFEPSSGTIDAPIGRSDTSIMLREVRENGRTAVTHYETLSYNEISGLSLMRFVLETGRCHQIRVHSLYRGHPLLGDGLYGVRSIEYPNENIFGIANEDRIHRQALHAAYLSFIHPVTQEKLCFESLLPEDMQIFLDP